MPPAQPLPSLGAILTDFSIRAFKIDEINQKIYFFGDCSCHDKVGFWVQHARRNNAERMNDAPMDDKSLYITGIAIDNVSKQSVLGLPQPTNHWSFISIGSWENYYKDHPTSYGRKNGNIGNTI